MDTIVKRLIENHKIEEMSTIGYFQSKVKGNKPKGHEMKVFTTSDNHPQVHVHIKGEKFICVKLDAPEYFIHDSYQDRFSPEEIEEFIKFLKAPSKQRVFTVGNIEYKLKTNWDYTIATWNEENREFPITIFKDAVGYIVTPPIPNYEKLR